MATWSDLPLEIRLWILQLNSSRAWHRRRESTTTFLEDRLRFPQPVLSRDVFMRTTRIALLHTDRGFWLWDPVADPVARFFRSGWLPW